MKKAGEFEPIVSDEGGSSLSARRWDLTGRPKTVMVKKVKNKLPYLGDPFTRWVAILSQLSRLSGDHPLTRDLVHELLRASTAQAQECHWSCAMCGLCRQRPMVRRWMLESGHVRWRQWDTVSTANLSWPRRSVAHCDSDLTATAAMSDARNGQNLPRVVNVGRWTIIIKDVDAALVGGHHRWKMLEDIMIYRCDVDYSGVTVPFPGVLWQTLATREISDSSLRLSESTMEERETGVAAPFSTNPTQSSKPTQRPKKHTTTSTAAEKTCGGNRYHGTKPLPIEVHTLRECGCRGAVFWTAVHMRTLSSSRNLRKLKVERGASLSPSRIDPEA
ncbi:hypothetical protein OBBRIDRAFT_805573 [Obba rivulosa]|uniref:Uncharacterized protein n=1 Tax=Obba rivulosa TaxID=1052685 RepID=A0A8E2ANU8_9APHY|nr:hypothetical protein OBBRIDRAFT_805573 [Obba rivulosa]